MLKWPKIIKLKKIHPPKYPINYVNRASEWYIVHTISYIRNACLKILSKISVFYILFFISCRYFLVGNVFNSKVFREILKERLLVERRGGK